MKVTVLSHLYPAPGHGQHLFVHEQVRALRELGVDVTVISPTAMTFGLGRFHPRLRRRRATPRQAVLDGVEVSYPRVPLLPRRFLFHRSGEMYCAGLRGEAQAMRRRGVDLLHAHQAMPDGAAAARLAASLGVPFIVTVHGADVYQHLPGGGRTAAQTRRTLQETAAVMAVSSKVARELSGIVPRERLFVNLNGTIGGLDPVAPADYRPGRRVILTAAYLIERKGHAVVLEALRRLREHGHDPVWAVAGDGPLHERLELRARELGVDDAVDFLGQIPHCELLRLMARADVFVLASWDEAFGLVYTEAMAQSTPIVACRDEGPEDFVRDGESGCLVPARDPAALADAVGRLLADDDLRRRIGGAGRDAVLDLTWEQNAKRQLNVYREVLRVPDRRLDDGPPAYGGADGRT